MVEIIGDKVMPSELIIPDLQMPAHTTPTISGAIWMSGAKLYWYDGTNVSLITSS